MELISETISVFIGFILGIFFEKWTESRSEKKWVKLALLSMHYDLTLDYKIFKPVLKMDRTRIDEDKTLLKKINEKTTLEDMFKIFDQIFKNSKKTQIWSNVTNDESNYIDLNRANYDNFIKNSNRDDLLDNTLKANLDWLYDGINPLYLSNRDNLMKAEYDLKRILTKIGYPVSFSDIKKTNLKSSIKNQILSQFEIYFELREKDLLTKKEILKFFKWNIERIKRNLEKPIISKVYKKDYEMPSLD
tara:strand:+ start:294 stop:1034 length:741 start_codon:yes stop_codon:yes gene_type:complete